MKIEKNQARQPFQHTLTTDAKYRPCSLPTRKLKIYQIPLQKPLKLMGCVIFYAKTSHAEIMSIKNMNGNGFLPHRGIHKPT